MTRIRQALLAGSLGLALGAATPALAQVSVELGAGHYDHIGGYYGSHHHHFTHGPSLSITIGKPLPEGHEIHAFPEGVHGHVPDHAHYGYYSTGDHIYVVRKKDRKVLREIRRGGA